MKSLTNLIKDTPPLIRYFFAPILWRAAILLLPVIFSEKVSNMLPYTSKSLDGVDKSSMFYSIAGIMGVLAGFVITALTIFATADSAPVRKMKGNAPSSLPAKLLYSVLTLLFTAFSIALAGPFCAGVVPYGILTGGITVALIEIFLVSILVYMSVSPKPPKKLHRH